ncbi:MAG: hypothetical protein A2504_10365 [Bdellovibrionales bacterium RIFOXYD12_FULL_39_22]|nr:MAG: hypothetical protein A2385_16980 [Bdellovibrionales bacterium RIFOXYB1_FULL_39_21]OFZ44117.1 MAG: hypothetical protein A2485_14260 [Bdellovibrionales bacterium RIFOXYC12_FULL_39_17]OFZ48649.1 MAG: hypothetical protein A2404_08185 [Bdellovibrionales bacterium RIFOXYC1_FULL_39_130]OFZ69317.1 MAG: hypothetical protein A2451_13430 [Bdellovibrionales bacterium RIFOXYC2_FULL_39_8]OFZ76763.1 MAG: hypothetical protein A2560_10475 [Bdellovibrionales bacterium RIFOXYD1_FULL_39_84]OFZ95066.1 MAG:
MTTEIELIPETPAIVDENSVINDFRQSRDVEKFYRFVHENDLRREAKLLINSVLQRVAALTKKKKGRPPKNVH